MQVRRSLITTGLTVAVTAAVTATLTTSVGASATPAAPPAAAAPAAAGGRAGGARAGSHHRHSAAARAAHEVADRHRGRHDALANDATYRRMVAEQFSTVTPENVMKWEVVEPQRGQYDFSAADQLVRVRPGARPEGARPHPRLAQPAAAWLTSGTWTPAQLRAILKQHIFTEVRHFRGQIWAWDVVNEAFNDDGTLRNDIWLQNARPRLHR